LFRDSLLASWGFNRGGREKEHRSGCPGGSPLGEENSHRFHVGGYGRDLLGYSPSLARILGIRRLGRSVRGLPAEGKSVRLGADLAVLRIDGRGASTTIVVGNDDEPILGVYALEALALVVDPNKKRLFPFRPYAVRPAGYRQTPPRNYSLHLQFC
jgi:hypothetical protein